MLSLLKYEGRFNYSHYIPSSAVHCKMSSSPLSASLLYGVGWSVLTAWKLSIYFQDPLNLEAKLFERRSSL